MSKRRIVERIKQKTAEKVTQKRKIVSSSDLRTYVEDDILDLITTARRNIDRNNVPLNVPDVPLDNFSFHSVANVQK